MKVITITNLKGGVGKTTTAINLACRLAADGYKVLQLDTDHQANMSKFYDVSSEENIHKLFCSGHPICPQEVRENLHLIPSDTQTATVNFELTANMNWHSVLRRILRHEVYQSNYDFCIIDCPPALDMIVANNLAAADYVLIPLTTGQFAFDGLRSIVQRIEETREFNNPDLKILGILLTMVSERTRAAKVVSELLKNEGLDISTCKSHIRQCEAFKLAELSHKSIFEYDPNSNGAIDIEMFYQEVYSIIK